MTDGAMQKQSNLKFKILTYSLLLFIICVIGLYAAPYFIKIDQQNIIEQINKVTGKKIVVKGKFSLSVNPLLDNAKISITNATLFNDEDGMNFATAKNLEINLSLHQLFFGRHNVISIGLHEADIDLDSWQDGDKNWILSQTFHENLPQLNSINVMNSSISYGVNNYSQVSVDASFSKDGSIKITGNAVDDNEKITFLAKAGSYLEKQKRNLVIDISKAGNHLYFDGSFVNSNDQFTLSGPVTSIIAQPIILKKEISSILPFLMAKANDNLLEHIDVSYDLSIIDTNVDLKNIKIASKKINGTGEISFNLGDNKNLAINLAFANIDMVNFLKFESEDNPDSDQAAEMANDYIASAMHYEQKDYIDFAFLDQNTVTINIAAKEISMPNFLIQDLAFQFNANNDEITQSGISFKVGSDTNQASLTIDNLLFKKIGDTKVIVGDFTSAGNNIDETLKLANLQHYISINDNNLNYALTSQIILAPKEISLFDINGAVGANGAFSGSIATQQKQLTDYNFDLKFKNLTLANFDLPLLRSRAYALLNKSHEDDYLSYFRWFRLLSSTYNIKIEFNNTEFKDEKITNFITECALEPGSMSITSHIESAFADGDFALALTAQALKPKLDIKVSGDNLDYNRFRNLFFNFLTDNDHNFAKQEPTSNPKNMIWSDQALNLFKIQKYATGMNFDIKNLHIGSRSIQDFKLAGHTSNDIFYLDNVYLGIGNGQLQARGNISFFEPMLYQFSFTGNGLEVKNIIANLLPNFNGIEGPISITGSIISQGNSEMDMVKNLDATASFSASQLTLHGINTDEIVDIALKRKTYPANQVLNNLNTALNHGDTVVMAVSGNITAKNGIVETKNTSFGSRFTGAAYAMLLNLNNMTISSNTEFLFTPTADAKTVNYNIIQNGSLLQDIQKEIRDTNLLSFVRKQYGLEVNNNAPLVQQPKLSDNQVLEQDTKNYLYHKLEKTEANTRQ